LGNGDEGEAEEWDVRKEEKTRLVVIMIL